MDALAGYGSSGSSDNASGDEKPKSALSGLLGNLSDASSDDDDALDVSAAATDATTGNDGNETNEPPGKRMRLDNEAGADHKSTSLPQHVLPPPRLLESNKADDNITDADPFQSLILSTKDYTSQLRQTLTQQLQTQTTKMPQKQEQLAEKLKLLKETIIQKNDDSTQQHNNSSNTSSFASHLKSKHEFGNPHLLKGIIDHFQITPLDSTQFKPFEFFDRLQVSEEKARIAAANYDAGTQQP